jgi:hypothetical protein
MANFRERITVLFNADANIHLITDLLTVRSVNDLIKYSCPHKTIEVTIKRFEGNSCTICKKEKKIQEVKQALYPPLINFNDYACIELIDEDTEKFNELPNRQQQICNTQNTIINKLAEQDMKLMTNYININTILNVVCQYGHTTQIVWRTAKNYERKLLCCDCEVLKQQVRVSAINNRHMNDEQLTILGNQYGWTFMGRTDTSGIYRWRCTNGHILLKTKHNIKSNRCKTCYDEHKVQELTNLTAEEIARKQVADTRRSELQKERKRISREQRTIT